jgi:hypothetical protein
MSRRNLSLKFTQSQIAIPKVKKSRRSCGSWETCVLVLVLVLPVNRDTTRKLRRAAESMKDASAKCINSRRTEKPRRANIPLTCPLATREPRARQPELGIPVCNAMKIPSSITWLPSLSAPSSDLLSPCLPKQPPSQLNLGQRDHFMTEFIS